MTACQNVKLAAKKQSTIDVVPMNVMLTNMDLTPVLLIAKKFVLEVGDVMAVANVLKIIMDHMGLKQIVRLLVHEKSEM